MGIYYNVAEGNFPAGDVWQIGLHTTNPAGTVEDAAAAWSAAADDFFNGADTTDGYLAICNSGLELTGYSTTEIDQSTGRNLGRIDSIATAVGGLTTAQLPNNNAIVASFRSALATRGGRGRFYLPAPDASEVLTSGLIDPDAIGTILGALGLMSTSLTGSSYLPIIWHRSTRTSTAIVSVDVGNVMDSQRRRRNKLVESRAGIAFGV